MYENDVDVWTNLRQLADDADASQSPEARAALTDAVRAVCDDQMRAAADKEEEAGGSAFPLGGKPEDEEKARRRQQKAHANEAHAFKKTWDETWDRLNYIPARPQPLREVHDGQARGAAAAIAAFEHTASSFLP